MLRKRISATANAANSIDVATSQTGCCGTEGTACTSVFNPVSGEQVMQSVSFIDASGNNFTYNFTGTPNSINPEDIRTALFEAFNDGGFYAESKNDIVCYAIQEGFLCIIIQIESTEKIYIQFDTLLDSAHNCNNPQAICEYCITIPASTNKATYEFDGITGEFSTAFDSGANTDTVAGLVDIAVNGIDSVATKNVTKKSNGNGTFFTITLFGNANSLLYINDNQMEKKNCFTSDLDITYFNIID